MNPMPCNKTRFSASDASFLAAAISLPLWVVLVCKGTVAFADDYNRAGVLVWSGFSFVIAIPFGCIVGHILSPAIYKGCNRTGLPRYVRAVLVHAGMAVVMVMMYLLVGIHPFVDALAVVPVIFGPMLGPPSLVGTLVYAHSTTSESGK